jgi:hypothetical protein
MFLNTPTLHSHIGNMEAQVALDEDGVEVHGIRLF